MPTQNSPSPVQRPMLNGRTASTSSLSRASPTAGVSSTAHRGSTHKIHRAHTAGHGRLANARNTSFGKNLNKLTKLHATHGSDESAGLPRTHSKAKLRTPSTSPSTTEMRRDSSNVSLPRVGSKTSVKRNSSTLSLKRNGLSGTQLGKAGRPTTPLRNSQAQGKSKHKESSDASAKFSVGSDEDEQDEDWTEDSNSHSPSTTRNSTTRNSSSGGLTQQRGDLLDDQPSSRVQPHFPDSPPESPATTSSSEAQSSQHISQPAINNVNPPRRSTRPPDVDAVTSRLLTHNASQKLQPQISSISATGTPGTQTPPIYTLHDSTNTTDTSMPENGVSRFLNPAGSSSGGSVTHPSVVQLQNALTNLQPPSSSSQHAGNNHSSNHRNRSPSPNPHAANGSDAAVRRAKSTGNLTSSVHPALASTTSTAVATAGDTPKRPPPSYNIDPGATRRPGGNTAAKLELWRTQVNIESSQGPPAHLLLGSGQSGLLGSEERRVRIWEKAEGEMGFLRRFRNPVVEGVGRVLRASGKAKVGSASGRRRDGRVVEEGAIGDGDGDGDKGGERGRERGKDGRPASHDGSGRRSVRFEVGGDGGGEGGGSGGAGGGGMMDEDGDLDEGHGEESGEVVQGILRRMWMGGE